MVRVRPDAAVVAVAIVAFGVALALAPVGATHPELPSPEGSPRAIEVRDGRARFEVAATGPESRTMVIVSALGRGRGPFPIRMVARPSVSPLPRGEGPGVRDAESTGEHRKQTSSIPKGRAEPLTPGPSPLGRGETISRPGLIEPPPTTFPPAERTFYLLAGGDDPTRASSYVAVLGRLRAVGKRIQVYVDARDVPLVVPGTLRDVVDTFDGSVFPDAGSRFGPASDVDGDGRFTVLISGGLTRLAGGKAAVDGFVRGSDFDPGLADPFGNRCDMMYLAANLDAGPHLRTVLAHEYTHAVTLSRKVVEVGVDGREEEGWLDEALAHLSEDRLGFSRSNIDHRVDAFLDAPERYRLVVEDYYAAGLFRSHGNRGATYLFLRWCVDRHGEGLVDALVRSRARGVANLEAATGSTFADLFRRWTVALARTGLDPSHPPEDGFRSLDPRDCLEGGILAGPRGSTLEVGGPADSWLAEGTTAHFARISGPSKAGSVEVEVEGPPGADLQVTVVPLPPGLAEMDLSIRGVEGADGRPAMVAEVAERAGTAVRLGALAWEPLTPADDPRNTAERRGGLDMLGIASAFGTSGLPASGRLRSRPIPIPPGASGPMAVKLVGTDAKGRRVAAWATLEPPWR